MDWIDTYWNCAAVLLGGVLIGVALTLIVQEIYLWWPKGEGLYPGL